MQLKQICGLLYIQKSHCPLIKTIVLFGIFVGYSCYKTDLEIQKCIYLFTNAYIFTFYWWSGDQKIYILERNLLIFSLSLKIRKFCPAYLFSQDGRIIIKKSFWFWPHVCRYLFIPHVCTGCLPYTKTILATWDIFMCKKKKKKSQKFLLSGTLYFTERDIKWII